MPAPVDYRDLPYLFQSGYYAMDIPKLRSRLKTARLLLGDVAETLQDFTEREKPPPIGFIAFDLDYYSSTVTALKIFEANHRYLLPRVACYFDDMVGDIDWAYNDFTANCWPSRGSTRSTTISKSRLLADYGSHVAAFLNRGTNRFLWPICSLILIMAHPSTR